MKIQMGFEQKLRFVETIRRILLSVPLNSDAGKLKILFLEGTWWILLCINVCTIIPLTLATYRFCDDTSTMTKSLTELMHVTETFANLIFCRIERAHFQILMSEMMNFLTMATSRERTILRKYVDRCLPFYLFVILITCATACIFVCGPLMIPKSLPIDAWYPFSIEPLFIKSLLYFLQSMAIVQAAFYSMIDLIVATLIWYAGARLEMLQLEFRNVIDEHQLRLRVRKHQQLIRLVQDIRQITRFVILKTPILMTIALTCGGLQLVRHEPLSVISQFILLMVISSIKLFVNAWPAENLINVSHGLAWSIYDSPWIGRSPKMLKSILIVIRRCQKPLVIPISHLIQIPLSLRLYATFITSAISYFTTLRAIAGE